MKTNLNELESHLFTFFCMILMDSEKAKYFGFDETEIVKIDKNDSKIYVNYYDIIKSEVYVDLSLPTEEIISKIFGQLFYPNFVKKVHKRIQKNQTTEYIISNPFSEINEEKSLFNYCNFLYFELGGKKMSNLSKIKEGDELYLKLSDDIFDEINTFPKDGHILISYCNKVLSQFEKSKKGISYGKIKKIFNTKLYRNLINIKDDAISYSLNFFAPNEVIGAGYSCDLMFIDPSNSNIKQMKMSKNAPKWRYINEGLNIFGICENSKCEAYKNEVIFKTFEGNCSLPEKGLIFDMIESRGKIRCPLCHKIFDPKTCGFYKCEYQFIGIKKEDGDEVRYDSKTRETKGNELEYYEPNGKKETVWFKLKIYVLPIQKIKYES